MSICSFNYENRKVSTTMNRESDRALRAMHEFLAEHATEDMSIEEVNTLLRDHMSEINSSIPRHMVEKDAKSAEDFIDLAEEAVQNGNDAEALRLVRKALKLNPNDLDAILMEIQLGESNPMNVIKRLRVAVDQGRRQLEKNGYFDEESVGEFWGILETRPFMRLREEYISKLKEYGMLRLAAAECEDMIRLNTNNNQGIRYILMHIYAALEEADSAERLLEKYSDHHEGQMLFPITLLYYKLGNTDKAENYLRLLTKTIRETKQFIRDMMDVGVNKYMDSRICEIMRRGGYSPLSEEELIMALYENSDIYNSAPAFFPWVADVLRIKRF